MLDTPQNCPKVLRNLLLYNLLMIVVKQTAITRKTTGWLRNLDNKTEAYAMYYFEKNRFAYIVQMPVSLFVLLPAGSIKQHCNRTGILVHLDLIWSLRSLQSLKNKYNLAILALDRCLIAAIVAIGEKVTKVRKITVSEKIANVL